MRKNKNIEMRIYELLGIKRFKKMAFSLREIFLRPFVSKMSEKEKYNFLYGTCDNYTLGKVKTLDDIKKYKKYLFINLGVHIVGILICIIALAETHFLVSSATAITFLGINSYCIMLQRYNAIRINRIIKKLTPRHEKQKEEITEKLKKENSLLLDPTYKIIDKEDQETSITFDDFLASATLGQLKQYREYVASFQRDNDPLIVYIPIEKRKILKLETKSSIKNKSAIN